MRAYYNEIDPKAAAWLRELIANNLIAPGDVDERSIEDVSPADLSGYTQCHFFAGIGVWSYALRLAGWPDDRPIWTGSCPCQPFSAAGKGKGFADERHLWPAFHWLIQQCRPQRVFGEQVAGKDGLTWLDLVSTDLEALDYACGAVSYAAAGIGAPQIRERLYWVADANDAGPQGWWQPGRERTVEWPSWARGVVGGMENADHQRCDGIDALLRERSSGRRSTGVSETARRGEVGRLADDAGVRRIEERSDASRGAFRDRSKGWSARLVNGGGNSRPSPINGFWRDADWLGCRDGKFRPVEPGTFPLAHGVAERVGLLRGYGNAIVAEQAQAFIESYCEVKAMIPAMAAE